MLVIAHIEDCPMDRTLLKARLGGDYEIKQFETLDEFIKSVEKFDLVIADLSLPDSYGHETLKCLKPIYKNTPILVMTGMAGAYMTGEIIAEFMNHGADNVISKDLLIDDHLKLVVKNMVV